jgi:hypothetical protein
MLDFPPSPKAGNQLSSISRAAKNRTVVSNLISSLVGRSQARSPTSKRKIKHTNPPRFRTSCLSTGPLLNQEPAIHWQGACLVRWVGYGGWETDGSIRYGTPFISDLLSDKVDWRSDYGMENMHFVVVRRPSGLVGMASLYNSELGAISAGPVEGCWC